MRFDQAVTTHSGRPMSSPPPTTRRSCDVLTLGTKWTTHAAVPSASLLCLVGISWDGERLGIVHKAILELAGDDQTSLLLFAEEIAAYLRAHQVRELLILRPPLTGPKAGSHLNQKSEAALWLQRQVRAQRASSVQVASWLKKNDVLLPEPDAFLPKRHRDLLERTFGAAAFALSKKLEQNHGERSEGTCA